MLTEKNISELDSATEKATLSALPVLASFLDMSRSTTAGLILRNELELRCAGTTTHI